MMEALRGVVSEASRAAEEAAEQAKAEEIKKKKRAGMMDYTYFDLSRACERGNVPMLERILQQGKLELNRPNKVRASSCFTAVDICFSYPSLHIT
jgi:1,6-anhydro-N-acetylmuramate kinase